MLLEHEKTASESALRGDGAAFSDAVRPRRAWIPAFASTTDSDGARVLY